MSGLLLQFTQALETPDSSPLIGHTDRMEMVSPALATGIKVTLASYLQSARVLAGGTPGLCILSVAETCFRGLMGAHFASFHWLVNFYFCHDEKFKS